MWPWPDLGLETLWPSCHTPLCIQIISWNFKPFWRRSPKVFHIWPWPWPPDLQNLISSSFASITSWTKVWWNSLHWVLTIFSGRPPRTHARTHGRRSHGRTTLKHNASDTPVSGGGVKEQCLFSQLWHCAKILRTLQLYSNYDQQIRLIMMNNVVKRANQKLLRNQRSILS